MKRFFTTLFFAVIACGFNTGAMGSISGCEYVGSYSASSVPNYSSVGANAQYNEYLNCSQMDVYKAGAYGMTFAIYDCKSCIDGYRVKSTDLTGFCNSGSTYGQCEEIISEEPEEPGACPLPSSINETIQNSFTGCSLDGITNCCTGFTIKKTSTLIIDTVQDIDGTRYYHTTNFGNGNCETYDYYIVALSPCNSSPLPYWSIQSCGSCPDSRFPQERQVSAFGIDICSFSYTDCAECLQDSDCPANDLDFVPDPYDSARLKKTTYSCDIVNPTDLGRVNTCRSSWEYKCADDFVPLDDSITSSLLQCVQCTERLHCPGDIDWVDEENARTQVYTAYFCENNACVPSTSRRCKAGYYGNGVVCDPCPSNKPLSPAGATQQSQCYADACTEASCQATGQHCDTSSGECVACTTKSHCGTDKTEDSGLNREKVTTYSCTSNHTCSHSVTYQCKSGFHGSITNPTTNEGLQCYECTSGDHCGGNTPYCSNNTCVECTQKSHCGTDTDWADVPNKTYQQKSIFSCLAGNTCDEDKPKRCKAGYYGDPDNNIACQKCPTSDPISSAGSTDASACTHDGCNSHSECSGNTQYCRTSDHVCVECITDINCGNSDSSFVSDSGVANRMKKTTNSCSSNNTCNPTETLYQCATNYYPLTNMQLPTTDSSLQCVQCTSDGHCSGNTRYCSNNHTCVQCMNDTHCPQGSWEVDNHGVQTLQTQSCKNNICTANPLEYQCAKGYYGSGQSCKKCPYHFNSQDVEIRNEGKTINAGETESEGSTDITACFITIPENPTERTWEDPTGKFEYVYDEVDDNKCYYE